MNASAANYYAKSLIGFGDVVEEQNTSDLLKQSGIRKQESNRFADCHLEIRRKEPSREDFRSLSVYLHQLSSDIPRPA